MGWANCGTDSKGRPIGYAHSGTCDHPGCDKPIDRGLTFACGGMHGNEDEKGWTDTCCEGYFCSEHLGIVGINRLGQEEYLIRICPSCEKALNELDGVIYDEEENTFMFF